jgi:hypothetical protein
MGHTGDKQALTTEEQLFLGLVEQLSRPFLQLSRLSELAATEDPLLAQSHWPVAQAIASASLNLVESYALSLRVNGQITPLELEPITVSSLLYDTAHVLQPFAKQYGVELELDSGRGLQPILTDRSVLQSAMVSLGQVFVLASAEGETKQPVRLAAHLSRYGVVAGLYGEHQQLGTDSLRRANALRGKARQPLQRLVSGPAAGVFVADSLLHTLSAHLHIARYHKLTGLAATLQPSQQLQLV